jgi:hypothetical protein
MLLSVTFVGIVTGLRERQTKNRGSMPCSRTGLRPSEGSRPALRPTQPSIHWVLWTVFGGKAPRAWSWPLTLMVQVKNGWSYSSISRYALTVCIATQLFFCLLLLLVQSISPFPAPLTYNSRIIKIIYLTVNSLCVALYLQPRTTKIYAITPIIRNWPVWHPSDDAT